ncbi:flagellin [Caulobacter sp. 17J80-11]|uniref:flagellin n=1 Tax=Caulobacter sp. 17J80-11 TaxID=2763502 RepID=UPI00165357A2|nr:flagellin [Caulobacter sp. 17J80-11]MBC6982627.1 flagellin [Caulobacter sp. 17J80-11]
MTRVSTANTYQSALLDLMRAQKRQSEAQSQVSTQKIADDLKGFGRGSETIAAFRSAQARMQGYIDAGGQVAQRLESQDLALTRVADAADGARQDIAEAIANGRLDGLMLDLQSRFSTAQDGLNFKHQGRYVFGGAQIDTPPVTADTLADLTAVPAAANVFVNDQLKTVSRLDDASSLQTGFLANEVGGSLFDAFRQIQAYHEGPNGPLTGQMNDTQRAFLQGIISTFGAAHEDVLQQAAQNGALQKRVDNHLESQKDQSVAMEELIGERTDADMAQAITALQQAQIAVQASAQVIGQLRNTSLLDILR